MALRVLRRHRYGPTAIALIGALLYAWLTASHIVSQATPAALAARGADTQVDFSPSVAGDSARHDHPSSASKEKEPGHSHPARAPSKCPFCLGYAALHIAVIGGFAYAVPPEALPQSFERIGRAQLTGSANPSSWHARAPPRLG